MKGANFTINSKANATTVCQEKSNSTNVFEQYGLVLGGQSQSYNVSVNGDVYLADNTSVGITAAGCSVDFKNGTGALDFDALKKASDEASKYLAKQTPSLFLSQKGKLKKINGTDEMSFYSLKFNTCGSASDCGVESSQASYPNNILFANGTKWKGVKFPKDKPLVFNVSVRRKERIRFFDHIFIHLDSCYYWYDFSY